MSKIIYLLATGMFLITLPAHAGLVSSDRKAVINNTKATAESKQVTVEFDIYPGIDGPGSNYKTYITPYLYAERDTLWLEPCIILGKNKARREARERALARIKVNPDADKIIPHKAVSHYSYTVAYRPWMQGASLGICQETEGCCKVELVSDETIATGLLPRKKVVPPKLSIPPSPQVAEVNKRWTFSREELIIDFRVARIEIASDLSDNARTLKEITDAVSTIRSNLHTRMNKIEITGYASPEGTVHQNTELGRNRSNALKNYLQKSINDLPDSLFLLNNGVENWKGLRRLVAASGMKYCDEVLRFIDDTPLIDPKTNESKNNKLKKLLGGEPYRYMLINFYPRLRNACYIAVYYDVLPDNAADLINQSVKLIEQRNYEKALNTLITVQTDKRAWNAIGVCYWLTGRTDEARPWFEKAAGEGDQQAIENLKLLTNN